MLYTCVNIRTDTDLCARSTLKVTLPWRPDGDSTMTTWWWLYHDDLMVTTMTTWWWLHHNDVMTTLPWRPDGDYTMTTSPWGTQTSVVLTHFHCVSIVQCHVQFFIIFFFCAGRHKKNLYLPVVGQSPRLLARKVKDNKAVNHGRISSVECSVNFFRSKDSFSRIVGKGWLFLFRLSVLLARCLIRGTNITLENNSLA